MDKDFKREVILDNYQHPTHKGLVDDNSFITKNTNNDINRKQPNSPKLEANTANMKSVPASGK